MNADRREKVVVEGVPVNEAVVATLAAGAATAAVESIVQAPRVDAVAIVPAADDAPSSGTAVDDATVVAVLRDGAIPGGEAAGSGGG